MVKVNFTKQGIVEIYIYIKPKVTMRSSLSVCLPFVQIYGFTPI